MENPTKIRFGCEFESIIRVPSFPHHDPIVWKQEVDAAYDKVQQCEAAVPAYLLEKGLESKNVDDWPGEAVDEYNRLDGLERAAKDAYKGLIKRKGALVAAWLHSAWGSYAAATDIGMLDLVNSNVPRDYSKWLITLDDAIIIPPENRDCRKLPL
jgi:hypothetical protein